jgi:hypothetical protein
MVVAQQRGLHGLFIGAGVPAAIAHQQQHVGRDARSQVQVVADHDHGLVLLAAQARKQACHAHLVRQVERIGWLVQQ